MIEVERKVRLEACHVEMLESMALCRQEISIQDTYFDAEDYRLTLSDKWLRKRNQRFELKVGVAGTPGSMDRYLEITDPQEIAQALSLDAFQGLEKELEKAQIVPFCSFRTRRKSYQHEGLTIDLDSADFGDLTYSVAEVEICVKHQDDMAQAEQKIIRFIEDLGIHEETPPAKLTFYLQHRRPHHYQTLVKAGVI